MTEKLVYVCSMCTDYLHPQCPARIVLNVKNLHVFRHKIFFAYHTYVPQWTEFSISALKS